MPNQDRENTFSSAQTTTTGTGSGSTPGVRSTNIYDSKKTGMKIGTGTPLYVVCIVTTALASSGSNDAMDIWFASDDAEAFNTPATLHYIIQTFPAVSAIGTVRIGVIRPEIAYLRYYGLYYISQTADAFSAGAVTAYVTDNFDGFTAYAKGYVAG